MVRFVAADGKALFRMPGANLGPEGLCFLLTDRVETSLLEPGDYTYHFRWNRAASEPVEGQVEFRLVAEAKAEAEPDVEPDVSSTVDGDPPTSAVSTAVVTQPVEQPQDPELARLQEQILARLANVARLYRDNALRFTCDETILFGGRGAPIMHKFRYLYRYSASEQALRDFRVPRYGFDLDELSEADRVQLDNYGLPVFLLRAYSWIFIFHADNQPLYRYALRGESKALHRPAWQIDFEPIPPIRELHNDWYGSAWVDRETYQLLRVEAQRPDDHAQEALMHSALQTARQSGRNRYHGTFPILSYTTEFDIEKNGMRFPGRSVIEKADYQVRGGAVVRTPIFRVSQTYKRYGFFGVRTAEEIRTIVNDPR